MRRILDHKISISVPRPRDIAHQAQDRLRSHYTGPSRFEAAKHILPIDQGSGTYRVFWFDAGLLDVRSTGIIPLLLTQMRKVACPFWRLKDRHGEAADANKTFDDELDFCHDVKNCTPVYSYN